MYRAERVPFMGKPKGSIGETKLKILAILSYNDDSSSPSYGYGIWKTLNERYYSCLGPGRLRNVYHHLHDLEQRNYIASCSNSSPNDTSERRLYNITQEGMAFQEKFNKYLKALTM
jgi:DNA-binding PadR family transcriptional regulator